MCNEKKSVLKELLNQINPHGHTNKRFQNSFKNEISFSHKTHTLLHTALRQTTTTTTTTLIITLSLSLQKRNNNTSAECERGVRLEYYARDDVCGERMCVFLKDLKTFLFPPRVKGEKKMHLGSQSKFLVSVPTFWGRPLPLLKVCHFGKKRNEREREKEDMRREL